MANDESHTIRGSVPFTIPMSWRLDGSPPRPDSPLVLCLHGQWMDEDIFALLLQDLRTLPFRFLTPRAPYPAVAPGGKRIGASWYPYDGNQERFLLELRRTEEALLELLAAVESEAKIAPGARIVLGFSQGGYTGSFVALRNTGLFDGLVVSGARVKAEVLEREIEEAGRRSFPVLLCHGSKDRSVPFEAAQRSLDALKRGGVDAELRPFDSGHEMGKEQVRTIRDWLRDRWPPPALPGTG